MRNDLVVILTAILMWSASTLLAYLGRVRRPLAKPPSFTAGKSLKERMETLGFVFAPLHDSINQVPKSIRHHFTVLNNSAVNRVNIPGCPVCHGDIRRCDSVNNVLHPGVLGWFCEICGVGVVIRAAIENRNALGLSKVDEKNLLSILLVVEHDAFKKGLLKPSGEMMEDKVPPVTFETTLDVSTGYLGKPTRVRVDVRDQTVVPVDAIPEDEREEESGVVEEQSRQKMRLVHSKE